MVLLYFLLPSLNLPFSLIDDVQFAQKAIDTRIGPGKFFTGFPGLNEGRFAPMFWAYFVSKFIILGHNPYLHHLVHIGLAGLSIVLLYILVRRVGKSRLAGFLAGMFFILLAPGWESWYRISTQEPIQVFFLLLFWLSLTKQKINLCLSGLLGAMLLLTKETSVALLLPLLILAFWDLRLRKITLIMAGLAGAVGAIIFWTISHASWSAENSGIVYILPSITTYFEILYKLYIPQITIAGLVVCILFWKKFNPEMKILAFQGLGITIAVMAALLIWKYPLLRLLMTFRLGLAIFLGVCANIVWQYRKNMVIPWLFFLVIIKTLWVNFLEIDYFRTHYLAREITNGKMLQYLADQNRKIVVGVNVAPDNIDASEWILMMPEYLEVFFRNQNVDFCVIDDCFKPEVKVWASWSMYEQYPKTYFSDPVFETENIAFPVRSSIKNLIFNPTHVRIKYFYRWSLFERFNPPSETLSPAGKTI